MTFAKRATLLALLTISTSFPQPSGGSVFNFEPIIQDEPRIKFGKGVEESVAPTTGSLAVTIKDVTLPGKGLPLEIKHHYDSSGVPSFSDEEIEGGNLSTFGVMYPLTGFYSYGGIFWTQFGANNALGIIKEGFIEDAVVQLVRYIPVVGETISTILKTVFGVLHLEYIDNSNIHTYMPQFTPSASRVRGFYAPHKKLSPADIDLFAFINALSSADTSQWANALFKVHPVRNISVVLDDNSTVGFEADFTQLTNMLAHFTFGLGGAIQNDETMVVQYYPTQPDNKKLYHLVFDARVQRYFFLMPDGKKYTMVPSAQPFLYLGMGDLNLRDLLNPGPTQNTTQSSNQDLTAVTKQFSKVKSLIQTLESRGKEPKPEPSVITPGTEIGKPVRYSDGTTTGTGGTGTGDTNTNVSADLSGLDGFLKLCMIPFGVVTEVKDSFDNTQIISYENNWMGIPMAITNIRDDLNRDTSLKYRFSFLEHFSASMGDRQELYWLKEINAPGGLTTRYQYSGSLFVPNPEVITISDPIGRNTRIYYNVASTPLEDELSRIFPLYENLNAFWTINRIDYPIGGFVEYQSTYLRDRALKSMYRDTDLTRPFVSKRVEHSSVNPTEDISSTTSFAYTFNERPSILFSSTLNISLADPQRLVQYFIEEAIRNALKLPSSGPAPLGGVSLGVYLTFIKEVTNGQTEITYPNGMVENYFMEKSNPGNFNHSAIGLSLNIGGLQSGTQTEKYPSRFQLRRITSTPEGVERQTQVNTYNSTWDLVRKENTQGSLSRTYTFAYDNYGNLLEETGPLGTRTVNSYLTGANYINPKQLKFITGLLDEKTVYNPISGNITTKNYFDLNGPLQGKLEKVEVTGTSGSFGFAFPLRRTTMTYQPWGEIATQTDPRGVTTTFTYDYGFQNNTQIRKTKSVTLNSQLLSGDIVSPNPETATTSQVFDFNRGTLLSESDALNRVTTYQNDILGRVVNVIFPDSTTLKYNYFDYVPGVNTDQRVEVIDNEQQSISGSMLVYRYDGLGRLKSLSQLAPGISYKRENFYNSSGLLSHVIDAQGRRTALEYDQRKRLKSINYPDGTRLSTQYQYDLSTGYQQILADALGNVTRYFFDPLDRLTKVQDAEAGTTIYDYDIAGHLLSFTDARNLTTSYRYNALGELKLELYPDGTQHSYDYDLGGQITAKTSARGHRLLYDYDALSRLTRVRYPLGRTVQYGYDLVGNKKFSLDSAFGKKEYDYNIRNWLTAERTTLANPDQSGSRSYTFGYEYNSVGNLVRETYPSGYEAGYEVDTLHRISKAKFGASGNPSPLAEYSYNPMGTVSEIRFGNSTKQTFAYDSRDRLTSTSVFTPSGSNAFHNAYSYDAVGNRTQTVEENRRTLKYYYDKLYRLKEVAYGFGSITANIQPSQKYFYDPVGNRTKHQGEGFANLYSYKANENQLTNVSILPAGSIEYRWDLNGNQTHQIHKRGPEKFRELQMSWDEEDRMTSIRFHNYDLDAHAIKGKEDLRDVISSNVYDDSGARVRKLQYYGDSLKYATTYIRKGLSVIEEYEGTSASILKSVYGAGVVRFDPAVGKTYYQYHDALGSTALVLDEVGGFVSRYKYDPFGGEEYSEEMAGFIENTRRHTGMTFDIESGLIENIHRFRDPFTGLWISKDRISGSLTEPQSLNRYAYVKNRPLILVDPDGDQANWLDEYQSGMANVRGATRGGGLGPAAPAPKPPPSPAPLPKIIIDPKKYPETAKHVRDAQASGKPSIVTVDRPGAPDRRNESLKGKEKVPGKQLDEYPPAVFKEGGKGASVRPINPADNMGSGASMGNQLRGIPDGAQVQLIVPPAVH